MSMLSKVDQLARSLRNRLAVQSLHELDHHLLVDIGLLRADVLASLRQSPSSDASKALKAVCCHWRNYLGAARPMPGAALCCE